MDTSNLPSFHVFQESDSDTCGPCCLVMVYAIKGKNISLSDILKDFNHGPKGKPTYVPELAKHLEKNNIKTNIFVSTSQIASPAWKDLPKETFIEMLKAWLAIHTKHNWYKNNSFLLSYLQEGGSVQMVSYTSTTIKEMLNKGSLVILGVDEDWVWEHRFKLVGDKRIVDEIGGVLEGHFVLVTSYKNDKFHVLDPFPTNLENRHGEYDIDENQLINASLTWDPQIIEILK